MQIFPVRIREIETIQIERRIAGQAPVLIIGRWRGRWHMIKQAIIFVERKEERGLPPNIGVDSESVQRASGEFSALQRT